MVIKYADWEIEELEKRELANMSSSALRKIDIAEFSRGLRGMLRKDNACRAKGVALSESSIMKAHAYIKRKYIDKLTNMSNGNCKDRDRLIAGIRHMSTLRPGTDTFIEDMTRAYVYARCIKSETTALITRDWLAAACVGALEQHYFDVEQPGNIVVDFDRNDDKGPSGYSVHGGAVSNVWVYPRKLRHYQQWGQGGKTGNWVTDKIQRLKSAKLLFTQKGLNRIVGGAMNDNDRIYSVYMSHNYKEAYIMGYVSIGEIRSLNLKPEKVSNSSELFYSVYLSELTTMVNSTEYNEVITCI